MPPGDLDKWFDTNLLVQYVPRLKLRLGFLVARSWLRLRVPLHQIKRPRSSDGVVIRQNSSSRHRFLHMILPNHLHRVVLQHKGKWLPKFEWNRVSDRKLDRVESSRVWPARATAEGSVLHFCYRKISIRTAYGGTKARLLYLACYKSRRLRVTRGTRRIKQGREVVGSGWGWKLSSCFHVQIPQAYSQSLSSSEGRSTRPRIFNLTLFISQYPPTVRRIAYCSFDNIARKREKRSHVRRVNLCPIIEDYPRCF